MSFTLLIPCNGDIQVLFNIRDYKVTETLSLSGLIHKNIDVSIRKTDKNTILFNENATRILSYHMNPCLIYENCDIMGDCILFIRIDKTSPILADMPLDRKDQIHYMLDQLDQIQKIKDIGTIPDDVSTYCMNRMKFLDEQILKGIDLSKAKEHLAYCMNSYGKLVKLT